MRYPPYAAPFPDTATPPVLGARQRAALTALGQRPGRLRSRTQLAGALAVPVLTPRQADQLVADINAALGDETVTVVPRRGLRMTPYVDAPVARSL